MITSKERGGRDIVEIKAKIVVSVDAMGGDHAPESVIAGANLIAQDTASFPNIHIKLYGDHDRISKLIKELPKLRATSTIVHAEQSIPADEKVASAMRNYKNSSMYLSLQSIKDGSAHAVVSAGNTGALMAISIITLRTLHNIHRPAIVAVMPSMTGKVVVLDLGANTECDANNLYQFAVMGRAFAKAILDIQSPQVGLLNIGSEESKGSDSIKLAKAMIQQSSIGKDFYGYIEGNDIALGTIDVAVTDGFTGNALLKAVGGYGAVYKDLIKRLVAQSWISKLKYVLFLKNELKKISSALDNRYYNGAMLVGINGIVVKSHGSMDAVGIANAIKVAYNLARFDINKHIDDALKPVDTTSHA
jgi:glycerol-3-phosphate acyltransferase PlsX